MHTDLEHRKRVKARFRAEGLENFDQTHVLELLLFYAVPRKDTKPLARRLLDEFGSIPKVLEAPMDALQNVAGVGPGIATFLHLLNDLDRYKRLCQNADVDRLDSLDLCGEYLTRFFYGQGHELVYLLCLDAGCRVITCRKLGEGGISTIGLSARQVMEVALSTGATSVVLAHNHPGGLAIPSAEDTVTTKHICTALATVDISLVDHIIVAGEEYVSMAKIGCFRPDDHRWML